MSLTIERRRPAFLLAALVWLAVPASAAPVDSALHGHSRNTRTTAQRLALYSPRVRKSTVAYLRLRLLELREAGLERARAAIERRLSIDEMLGTAAPPPAGTASQSGLEPKPGPL